MHSICTIKYKDATWNYFAVVNFGSICHFFKIKWKLVNIRIEIVQLYLWTKTKEIVPLKYTSDLNI
jgi:hypothetical protein